MSEQLEQLQDKLIRLGDRVVDGANIAIDKMPEVYQQLYQAKVLRMQVEAGVSIGVSVAFFVACTFLLYKALKRRLDLDNDAPDSVIFGFLYRGILVCAIFATIINLIRAELWLRLFAPEVVLWSNFLDGITGSMLK